MVFDLIIIGGDTAGLTAGIYAGRKKLSTLLLTKKRGGQSVLTNMIENFPGFDVISGRELNDKMRAQAEKYGIEIKDDYEVSSIEKNNNSLLVKTKNGEDFESKAIIIATGKNPRRLNIPGEKEFENRGVSFCSICDAPLFGGKDVVVVGGGNAGFETAMDLTKYANKIYILEFEPSLTGDGILRDRLRDTGKVEFITNAEIKKIEGSDFVEKIAYNDRETGEQKEIPAGGVFINTGWIPATDFLRGFIDLNKYGEIITDQKTGKTSLSGVFAAGDVTDSIYKQIVTAASDGAKAALSAYEYLIKS